MNRYLLLLLIFLSAPLLVAGKEIFRFEEVPALSGLRNNEVMTMMEDSDGFIWIGTRGGLYKFDGYEILSFKSNIYTPDVLTNNWITALMEDDDKNIYIGTRNGLNVLDKRTGYIRKFDVSCMRNNSIGSLALTDDGQIFIGTDRGLYCYCPDTDVFKRTHNKDLEYGAVKGMYTDSNGETWVGTWNKGLYRYSPDGKWCRYPQLTQANSAHVISEDSIGRLWVGTFGDGLLMITNQYDVDNFKVTLFDNGSDNGIADDFIYAIHENHKTNTIWVGTRKGISVIGTDAVRPDAKWTNFFPSTKPYSLRFNDVDTIISDREDNIWVGTFDGIQFINTSLQDFKYNDLHTTLNELKSSSVNSILVDGDEIWTSISSCGYSITDVGSGKEKTFSDYDVSNAGNYLRTIPHVYKSDTNGDILMGTISGLFIKPRNSCAVRYAAVPGLPDSKINYIRELPGRGFLVCGVKVLGMVGFDYRDYVACQHLEPIEYTCTVPFETNSYFAGTASHGLRKVVWNPVTGNTEIVRYEIERNNTDSDIINVLFMDSDKRIWAGTDGAGLCFYDRKEDRFVSMNTLINFPTDNITSIEEDEAGFLWLGSNIGLIHFFPHKELKESSFRLYDTSNGIRNTFFRSRASFKTDEGDMYFGTQKGYVYFTPAKISNNASDSFTYITDIKIDNQSITSMPKELRLKMAPNSPEYTDEIKLDHKHNNVSLYFSPLSYSMPNKIRYAYRLEGFDNCWQYADYQHRVAHYSNLRPGKYRFEIKNTNEDGLWNSNSRSLTIEVAPPIYKTWWAYILYVSIFVSIVTILYCSARQRLKYKSEIQLQKTENERNVELNQAKLKFFTNITHELFTPLTIISAGVEELRDRVDPREYEVISSNINRLIRLIQQILEFRKAETGNLKLKVSEKDIVRAITKNIESFDLLMKHKNMSIDFSCDRYSHLAVFDTDKVDKILYNLLSNALKYNTEGAQINVGLSFVEDETKAVFYVKDNGAGLSGRTMENLFKRFYDGDFRKYNTQGTGIGLSLVNDLVKLHKGEIEVDNRPGEGVTFVVTIPITKEAYTAEELSDLTDSKAGIPVGKDNDEELRSEAQLYNILIVEDNPDLNYMLQNMLSKSYIVHSADNGIEALNIIKEKDIDIIVSDVMMPQMDGYELCERVKTDMEFSHIPIILLTAKTDEDDVVNAYKLGADAFIPKPFSAKRLNARIGNLLEAREKRIEKFKKESSAGGAVINIKTIDYATYDEKFLNSVIEIINANYTDPEFDQNSLLHQLGVSKSTLHRKLISLTGVTATYLIKNARLKAAYDLLMNKGGTMVSEIAYAVGFNDAKYFSLCFKKEFGVLPSDIGKEEDKS